MLYLSSIPYSNWAIMNKETRRLSKFPDEVRAELEKYFVDRPPIIEENTSINYPKQDTPIVHVCNGLTVSYISSTRVTLLVSFLITTS